MVLDRLETQREPFGNGGIRITLSLSHQLEDIALPIRQGGKGQLRNRCWKDGEVMDQTVSNGRAIDDFASMHRAYRPYQFLLIGILEHIAAHSAPHGSEDEAIIFKQGHHQNPYLWLCLHESTR